MLVVRLLHLVGYTAIALFDMDHGAQKRLIFNLISLASGLVELAMHYSDTSLGVNTRQYRIRQERVVCYLIILLFHFIFDPITTIIVEYTGDYPDPIPFNRMQEGLSIFFGSINVMVWFMIPFGPDHRGPIVHRVYTRNRKRIN